MKKKLLNNWILKIFSLLFAFVLWLIVINMTDPVDDKTFTNIKVNPVNTELITEENMVYEVLDGTNVLRSVKVTAVKSVLDDLSAEDIVAEADFADLTINDTIEIKFTCSKDVKEIKGSQDMLKLNIEEKKTKRLDLDVKVANVGDGYMVGKVITDYNRIEVSGPESIVSKVNTASVSVDVTEATSDVYTYGDVKLYDADGREVVSEFLSVKVKSVKLTVQIWKKKEVPLVFQASGIPGAGYITTGVVESNPATAVIAGSASAVAAVGQITIPPEALDITGQTANVVTTINVKDYLPDNVTLTDDFNGKTEVTVYIEKEETKVLNLDADRIRISGVPSGFTAEVDPADGLYSVSIAGLASSVTPVKEDSLYGHINIGDWMQTEGMEELKAGTYRIEVGFSFNSDIDITQPMLVNIKISKTEE